MTGDNGGKNQCDAPTTAIRGVGEQIAVLLGKLGLFTVYDVLSHYPSRYEDRSKFLSFGELVDGQPAIVSARVTAVENRPTRNKQVITKVTLDDGNKGVATLTFFNNWRLKATFEKLVRKQIIAYGIVKRAYNSLEITQPEWEALEEGAETESLSLGRIVPIFAGTDGLPQGRLRRIIFEALRQFADSVPDPVPPALRVKRRLLALPDALRRIHFPPDVAALEPARSRLVYEELLTLQLLLAERKLLAKGRPGIAFAGTAEPLAEFVAALPFEPTGAQLRVMEEIAADMRAPQPMNRLVQGDVGSGKTAVAMAAMAIAVRGGHQAALMAPTELLAEQHLRSIRGVLEDGLGIRVDLLTGSRPEREKRAVRERVAIGETGVVVGTHALIQEGVQFHRLGLAVIDEQHRFGVLQRAALSDKGGNPDILVMTATPIPRTLTMTLYGDLDVSVIDELPPGRKPIRTHWKRTMDKASVYDGVRKIIAQGRQAYVVCPLVEESEKVQAGAATELAAYLQEQVFPDLTVGLLHGQMNGDRKDAEMLRFRSGEIHILVTTTVIEVGVDVPNAAVMVIEDADRFGLAQLHQLRGRVGRGQHSSFCILIADTNTPEGEARMRVLTETGDGFKIAEADLRLRGPGEMEGVRQSGAAAFRIADLLRDTEILIQAREDAGGLLAVDPLLERPENQGLLRLVQKRREAMAVAASGEAAFHP